MTPASLYLARRRTSHKRGSVIYKALPVETSRIQRQKLRGRRGVFAAEFACWGLLS